MKSPIKIIIVDDNDTFLQSVEFYMNLKDNYTIINKAGNGKEFLELSNIHAAEIVLMDIEMPIINGINATKLALMDYNFLNVIALTNYAEKAYLTQLITAGFKGCIFKKNFFEQIDTAINDVIRKHLYFPGDIKI